MPLPQPEPQSPAAFAMLKPLSDHHLLLRSITVNQTNLVFLKRDLQDSVSFSQTNNELDAQWEATEFAYRKRICEIDRALDELKWQKKNTKEEIADTEDEIKRLEEDLRLKRGPLKLVHTRLENHTYRPNADLCRDKAHYGLTDEVHQLEGTIAALKQKLAQTQDALDALYKHLARIQEDIRIKENTLQQDNRSMDTRKKLTVQAEKYMPTVENL